MTRNKRFLDPEGKLCLSNQSTPLIRSNVFVFSKKNSLFLALLSSFSYPVCVTMVIHSVTIAEEVLCSEKLTEKLCGA